MRKYKINLRVFQNRKHSTPSGMKSTQPEIIASFDSNELLDFEQSATVFFFFLSLPQRLHLPKTMMLCFTISDQYWKLK